MDNHNMFHKLTTAKINSHTITIHPQYCQHWALGQGCLILPVMATILHPTALNHCVVHSSIHDYCVIFIGNIKIIFTSAKIPIFLSNL